MVPPFKRRRKADLFTLVLLVATLGTALTLLYQVHLYYGGQSVPIARQAPAATPDELVDG